MNLSGLNALVIGQGSIGQRHAKLLRGQHAAVATVSRRHEHAYPSLADAWRAGPFDYVVIANETAQHAASVADLQKLSFDGVLLIEKPLSDHPVDFGPSLPFERVGIAYNLRFHPVIDALRMALQGQTPVDVRIHVGQHLTGWRPGSDYRLQSSAKRSSGGGALRDLSHEIDLLLHLFGPWKRLVSLGGNRGVLGIETDETWSILLEMQSGANVSLTLNYLDRKVERRIVVNTRRDTIQADLIAGSLTSVNVNVSFEVDRDQTYLAQHFAMLEKADRTVCSLEEGYEVMLTIAAIERSAAEEKWIMR